MPYTDSIVAGPVELALEGVWIHDPEAAGDTARWFPYGASMRSTEVDTYGEAAWYAGRMSPVVDYGDPTGQTFTVGVEIPHGVTWFEDVAALRAFAENKRPIVFRDNRGRYAYGAMSGYKEADQDWGTSASFTVMRTHYSETTVED